MARRSTLRASDSDRELIAERLRHATADGRLLAEELEERLGAALTARTYGELDALVADLPAEHVARRTRPGHLAPRAIGLAVVAVVVLAVMAVVVVVATGLVALWLVWLVICWWLFGHRRWAYWSRPRRHRSRRSVSGPRRI